MQPQPPPDEAARQEALDRIKRRATGLLAGASVVFVVARVLEHRYPWIGLLRATAEASMVGGLADWFAVTALFRHPLGLRIPHTAIVPRRKDRVGRTLGAFVQKNFLTREVIAGRLAGVRAGERLAEWISRPEHVRLIARHTASALASASQMVDDREVEAMVDRTVAERVRATPVAPLLRRLLTVVTEGNRHQRLLDQVLGLTSRAVADNRALIRTRIEEESPWWIPEAVDERIYKKIVDAIERTLVQVRGDPLHPLRSRFDTALRDFMDDLERSPEVASRVETLKEELLGSDAARRFSASLWQHGKGALVRYYDKLQGAASGEDEGPPPGAIERAITGFGERVLADPVLLQRVDDFILDVTMFIVERYQSEVADLIAHTVEKWDPELTSRRIELAIGRDLQFIRINGTLVGGLAGAVIYLVSRLLP